MPTINPSVCNDPTAPHRREKQPQAFPVDFERINPKLGEFIGGKRAVDCLNLHFMAFNGINAIARLLRANVVARECAEPSMGNSITDDLLAAAISLSRLAADEIEHLADSTNAHASEVRHG